MSDARTLDEALGLIDGMIENTEQVIAEESIESNDDPDGRHEALAAYRLTRDDLLVVYGVVGTE